MKGERLIEADLGFLLGDLAEVFLVAGHVNARMARLFGYIESKRKRRALFIIVMMCKLEIFSLLGKHASRLIKGFSKVWLVFTVRGYCIVGACYLL